LKDPARADLATEDEPRPGRARKPLGWSMITIGVLVAVSATLVWRRDGISGVLEILTHDLSLFGGILPRVLAGCLLGAFIAEILPHEKVSRSLGPESGLKGLLIGTAFGAILPGGPFTAYPVASALLAVGADFGATGRCLPSSACCSGKSRSCRPVSCGSGLRFPFRSRSWPPPSPWRSGSRSVRRGKLPSVNAPTGTPILAVA
jgi:hypothetical protein